VDLILRYILDEDTYTTLTSRTDGSEDSPVIVEDTLLEESLDSDAPVLEEPKRKEKKDEDTPEPKRKEKKDYDEHKRKDSTPEDLKPHRKDSFAPDDADKKKDKSKKKKTI
jgi:hypothetical protein